MVVLSGKGGTGKTTLSVNLAAAAGAEAALLDCDVEEPNGHLFVCPDLARPVPAVTRFPVIDEDLCLHCGKCAGFCAFNALVSTKRMNIVMAELCHDCGGCALVCPVGAVTFGEREIGRTGVGIRPEGGDFVDGLLNTGEYSAERVIDQVLSASVSGNYRIIDAPPGCACAAVKAAEGAHFALIVIEPTPFALSDMKMVVEMLDKLKIPAGVFINKAGENEEELLAYCASKNLPVLGKLPFSEEYSRTYTTGGRLYDNHTEAALRFDKLWSALKERVNRP